MDDTFVKAILVSLVVAVALGPFIASRAAQRVPIHGGIVAYGLHLVASIALMGALPGVIASLVLGGGFKTAFPVALTFIFGSLLILVMFAIIEKPALDKASIPQEDRGWTAEDARTSGL